MTGEGDYDLQDGFKHDFLSFVGSFVFKSFYFDLKVVKTLGVLLLFLEL